MIVAQPENPYILNVIGLNGKYTKFKAVTASLMVCWKDDAPVITTSNAH